MPKNNSNQCPNCCRWFNNSRSLKLHITSCRKKHFGDGGLTKNDNSSPLKSTERNTDLNKYVHEETNDIDVNTDNFHCGNFSDEKRLNLHPSDNMLLGDFLHIILTTIYLLKKQQIIVTILEIEQQQ